MVFDWWTFTDTIFTNIILTKLDLKHTIIYIKYFGCEVKNLEITYEETTRIFKALCDERRLKVLELLKNGEECACLLLEQLNMAQSSLSYHMKILCDSGIVDSRQDGKWTYYKISENGSNSAVELLKKITTPNKLDNISRCC